MNDAIGTWITALNSLAIRVALFLLISCTSGVAHGYTCSIPGTTFTPITYEPEGVTVLRTFQISCRKTNTQEPNSVALELSINPGSYASAGGRRARNTVVNTDFLSYVLYPPAATGVCGGTEWGDNSVGNSTSFTMVGVTSRLTNTTVTLSYCVFVPGRAVNPVPSSGTYSDPSLITVRYLADGRPNSPATTTASGALTPSVSVPSGSCSLQTSAASNINIGSYLAFGPAVTAQGSMTVACTTSNRNWLAILLGDPNGVVSGLQYSIGFTQPAPLNGNPMQVQGVGASTQIVYRVTVPAGQAGCVPPAAACNQTDTRTIELRF